MEPEELDELIGDIQTVAVVGATCCALLTISVLVSGRLHAASAIQQPTTADPAAAQLHTVEQRLGTEQPLPESRMRANDALVAGVCPA
jgi:hypothetical protein